MSRTGAILTIERLGQDGKILEGHSQPSRSFLKHFFDLLYPQLNLGVNSLSGVTDVLGNNQNLSALGQGWNSYNLFVGGQAGGIPTLCVQSGQYHSYQYSGSYSGLVVGTGSTAVTPLDNSLANRVVHGEGAGQLLYGGTELYNLWATNPNAGFNIRRYFTNVAGGAIVIQEAGLYLWAKTGNNECPFCCLRDVVSPSVTVNNGEILRAVYQILITV